MKDMQKQITAQVRQQQRKTVGRLIRVVPTRDKLARARELFAMPVAELNKLSVGAGEVKRDA